MTADTTAVQHEVDISSEIASSHPPGQPEERSILFPLSPGHFSTALYTAIKYGDDLTVAELLRHLQHTFQSHVNCGLTRCAHHHVKSLHAFLHILEGVLWRLNDFPHNDPFIFPLRCLMFDAITPLLHIIFKMETNRNIKGFLKPQLRSLSITILELGFLGDEIMADCAMNVLGTTTFEIQDWELIMDALTRPATASNVEFYRKFHFFATSFHFCDQMIPHGLLSVQNLLELTVDATFTFAAKVWREGAQDDDFISLGGFLDIVWRYLHDSAQCLCPDCSKGFPRLILGGLPRLLAFLLSNIHSLNEKELLEHEEYFEPLASILEHLLENEEPTTWYLLYTEKELDGIIVQATGKETEIIRKARQSLENQLPSCPKSFNLFGNSQCPLLPGYEAKEGAVTALLRLYRQWPKVIDHNIIRIKELANRTFGNVLRRHLDLAYAVEREILPKWLPEIVERSQSTVKRI